MAKQALRHAETFKVRRQNKLANNIHQTILSLDSELIVAIDWQYRDRLVKAAYVLRNLEEYIQRDSESVVPS